MSEYLPGAVFVKGADVIRPPKGQAGEYAPLATNPYVGCGHACKYCYVPAATHQTRINFNSGAKPRLDFIPRLERDLVRYAEAGVRDGHPADQVFVTFTSDPFHPGDVGPTVATLERLVDGGMSFCTLSKGGTKAVDFLPLYRPTRDAYAATLTTVDDDDFSRMWEPGARLPRDRIAALKTFHAAGIFTWVSLEPTLDVTQSLRIIRETHRFVNLYKVGRANYLKEITRTTDWRDYTLRMIDELNRFDAQHYIKIDLQPYLPDGYNNPLRVPQHN